MLKINFISTIRKEFYLILTAIFIALWAIVNLIRVNFILNEPLDFEAFYYSGKQIFKDPGKLYEVYDYYYMPNFAILFAISISLIPIVIAHYIWYLINYILAFFTIIEFNKILKLMDVDKKIHRLIFLLVISNGYFVYYQFRFNQTKFLLFLILLFIIRKEITFEKVKSEKSIKFYFINYNLFIFALGMAPYLIFLILICLFHDIPYKKLFNRKNVKVYFIIISSFLIQNFLFLLYPKLIFDFLGGLFYLQQKGIELFYLREWFIVSEKNSVIMSIVIIILLIIITLFLLLYRKIKIQEKFSYFFLFYILIGAYSYQIFILLILFGFVLLIFVPYLNQNARGVNFFKENKLILIGLSSILLISFTPPAFEIFNVVPMLQNYPFNIIVYFRFIFLLSITLISILILKVHKNPFHKFDK